MTNQEAFNIMVQHLIQQGRPAYDPQTHSCRYRTKDGLKCAVGALIPDEDYTPSMEDKSALLIDFNFSVDKVFLNLCQMKLHDFRVKSDNFVEDVKIAAREVARSWGLNLNEALNPQGAQ